MNLYNATEMREMAEINDIKASHCRAQSRPGAAEEYETTAQMLRQAADAMEAAEKATRPFTDADLATFAAMQDKGEP